MVIETRRYKRNYDEFIDDEFTDDEFIDDEFY